MLYIICKRTIRDQNLQANFVGIRQMSQKPKRAMRFALLFLVVGRGGFEPPKSLTADLQSAPFSHSGTYPYIIFIVLYAVYTGAGDWNRTHNLLITNQLLCHWATPACGRDTSLFPNCLPVWVVPWGGIEPPTGRFSVCCSTDWATKA